MTKRTMRSTSDKIFDAVNVFLLLVIVVIMVYPMYFTVVASFSDPNQVQLGKTFWFFKGFNTDAYYNVMKNDSIWRGYANSIYITVTGTLVALAFTIPAAYVMSRRYLKGRQLLMIYFMVTMYFGGGLIPSYLVNKQLGLVNTHAVLIIGGAFSVYNMIIVRTFYMGNFPDEIYEAAKLDGCSEIGIFFKMALPLSGAIVAVIALYNAVGHWNSYFSGLIYLSDQDKWPLQLVLRSILIQNQNMGIDMDRLRTASAEELEMMYKKAQLAETMKYSLIFIASLPMLVAYPFVQKFFVKGVMIGSVKG